MAMTLRSSLNKISAMLPHSVGRVGQMVYSQMPLTFRFGRAFRVSSQLLERSQYWPAEYYEIYQLYLLKALLRHAYNNIPFYRHKYDLHKIRINDIEAYSDIKYLPIVTKRDIRENVAQMKARNYNGSAFQYHTTGGSTGTPVGLFWDASRTVPIERAFMRRQWGWVGYKMDRDRSIVLRGTPVKGGALYEIVNHNQLRLSVYNMTKRNLGEYISIINDFRPVAIHAYPSAAYILARHIIDKGNKGFPSLRVVLCGSENLYQSQRTVIEAAFGCRVYSWYGQSEYVALAGECEYSNDYHCYSEYGITEVLTRGNSAARPGEVGEIVATGFNNLAMPLIRYRTEDIARVSTVKECCCGRHYPLIERIEGRLQEMIVSKNGNLISMTAINMHDGVFDDVFQFQFYQDRPGILELRIVRKDSYSMTSEAAIRRELYKKLQNQFDLRIEYADSIQVTDRGKAKFLIQKLPIQDDFEET
jgi:phenylacetate-CoA ligase